MGCSKAFPLPPNCSALQWVYDTRMATKAALEYRATVAFFLEGVGVWEWTYETDPNDAEWPPLFRATVQIPVLGKWFAGGWARGQREAQIEAIGRVNAFLDDDNETLGLKLLDA